MKAKEIAKIVDAMFEDELDVLLDLLSLADPERSDAMILRENGRPFCPGCGCAMSRNGTDGRGHQKWICTHVPDKFHVMRDLRKAIGEEFDEVWLYDAEKLAEMAGRLRGSDSAGAAKLRRLMLRRPGMFEAYRKEDY